MISASPAPEDREALEWLYGTQLFGMKLGLENTRRLLDAIELPARRQRFIHIAGTNGKGSTCAFMHSILRASGIRAGLFTSPHLIEFGERIRDDARMISHEEIAAGIGRIRALVSDWEPHPTFFEIALALALDWFRARELPWVVLETGLGGRLDATNAITPAVSVITPIGMDHMQILGSTLAEIAAEKAGIIKPGVPVVCAPQEPDAMEVIVRVAKEKHAPLTVVTEPASGKLGLAGPHQAWNAALAVAAVRLMGLDVSDEQIASGLRETVWPARFQRLDARTFLDGAHNEPAAQALAEAWRHEFGGEKATIILGASTGKDTAATLRALAPVAARWIFTGFDSPRTLAPGIAREMLAAPHETHIALDITEALAFATRFSERKLITGSLYFAGEVLARHEARIESRERSDQ